MSGAGAPGAEPRRGGGRLITVTRVIRLILAGLLAAAVAACGATAAPAGGGQPSDGGPAGSTHGPGSPGGCGSDVVLRDAASGSTVCVIRGSDLTVMLRNPPGANWSSPRLTGAALGPGAPIPTPSGYVGWSFRAMAAGPAGISLTRRACPSASPGTVSCDALLLYRLRVTVR